MLTIRGGTDINAVAWRLSRRYAAEFSQGLARAALDGRRAWCPVSSFRKSGAGWGQR